MGRLPSIKNRPSSERIKRSPLLVVFWALNDGWPIDKEKVNHYWPRPNGSRYNLRSMIVLQEVSKYCHGSSGQCFWLEMLNVFISCPVPGSGTFWKWRVLQMALDYSVEGRQLFGVSQGICPGSGMRLKTTVIFSDSSFFWYGETVGRSQKNHQRVGNRSCLMDVSFNTVGWAIYGAIG